MKIITWDKKEKVEVKGKFERIPVIIDMQNDFVKKEFPVNGHKDNGKLVVAGAEEIIQKIANLIEQYRKQEVPIIYTTDWHPYFADEFKVWPIHCVIGTKGAEIIDELKPNGQDFVIQKNANAAFTNPNTLDLLKALNAKEFLVTGVATDYCIKNFAIDAAKNGFKVIVNLDMVKGVDLNKGDIDKAIAEMKAAGVELI